MIERGDLELFGRSLRQAVDGATGGGLDAALDELGWIDVVGEDPAAGISLLFSLQGRALATSSALDRLLALRLGVAAPSVVLPATGRWSPPGAVSGDRLAVDGLGTAAMADAGTVLVVTGGGRSATTVEAASLDLHPLPGIDPALGLVRVRGETALGAGRTGTVDWSSAVAWGQLAVGHELVGASRRMLELARQHALDRVQFGQPIARFQAVRHRLAETLVALDLADAALEAAWLDPTPQSAAIAKAVAGRAGRTAARHCQQVMGAIGFTTEHDLHRYVRRVLVLEQLFGGTAPLTRRLGEEILERRRVPAALPL
ncbi:MAG: acyl-CoA dehydrogenase family protein [Acidimicrobiales bacterium]